MPESREKKCVLTNVSKIKQVVSHKQRQARMSGSAIYSSMNVLVDVTDIKHGSIKELSLKYTKFTNFYPLQKYVQINYYVPKKKKDLIFLLCCAISIVSFMNEMFSFYV